MQMIKTKSFSIAANIFGEENAKKVALLLPGRLDTKDYINFTIHSEIFVKKGFLTVVIDPPGTWESVDDTVFTTTNYIKSVNELIDYFGNKSTFLFGHSRGG